MAESLFARAAAVLQVACADGDIATCGRRNGFGRHVAIPLSEWVGRFVFEEGCLCGPTAVWSEIEFDVEDIMRVFPQGSVDRRSLH